MAACSFPGCDREVETHRYLRAEPMKAEERDGRETLAPIDLKASRFFHLDHPLEGIEERIAELLPPSGDVPVRLLWSPAPGVRLRHFFVPQDLRRFETIEALTEARNKCSVCGDGPGAGIHRYEPAALVSERRSSNGQHGVRSIVVRDKGALHVALPELVPPDAEWFVPHTGEIETPQQAADVLSRLFGDDDETSRAIRAKVANLGKGA